MLNPFFYPYAGGTERVLLEVYSRLSKRHNVTVISAALNDKNKGSVEHVKGIKVVRLKTLHLDFPALPMPFPVMRGLPDAIQKAGADIYHINNRYLYFFNTINAIKKMNRSLALTLHDAMPSNIDTITDRGGYLYDVVWGRRLMEYADVITAVSENTLKTTVPEKYRDRAYVIYNGVDTDRYRPRSKNDRDVVRIRKELGLSNDSITIMNNGRLVPQKGQVYLIRAFAEIVKRRKGLDLNLLIIGRGPLKDTLMYMARDLGIDYRVQMLTGIDEMEMPYYYNASDMFVSASLYEPASLSVMEALASQLPVVATKVGGVPEMMHANGVYTKPHSISGLRTGITNVLENMTSAGKRAARGRELMIKEHDWNSIAKDYERIFESTLRN